jgi:polar amino acid transport system substrate-binding protein
MAFRSSFILFSLVALLGLGCATPGRAPDPAGGLARIIQAGELRVGMSGEQPPLNMTTRSGEIIGLEVALMKVLAANLGVEMRIVQKPFGGLLDALEAGEVDVVMSGMTITPERNVRAAFVGPYFVSGQSILTKHRTLVAVNETAELDASHLHFAALAGSTSERFVRFALPRAGLTTTASLDEAIQMVLADQVDAMVADLEICHVARLRHPEAGLAVLADPLTTEPIGIAVPPEDTLLANMLENYLEALEGTGVLARARAVWFEDASWVRELR